MFSMYAGVAVNLFKKIADRIQLTANKTEYQVVPDRSQQINFETHRILNMHLHSTGITEKVPVYPLYQTGFAGKNPSGLGYMIRRLARKSSERERAFGTKYIVTRFRDLYLNYATRCLYSQWRNFRIKPTNIMFQPASCARFAYRTRKSRFYFKRTP